VPRVTASFDHLFGQDPSPPEVPFKVKPVALP
jgi:hypothetical protein